MTIIDRRAVLAAALAAPMLPGVRLFAAPAAAPRLMVLFLRGAYDCASTLVPFNSSFYYEARPTIAIPRAGAGAVIPLDSDWGLNPALEASLLPFWKRRELAIIPFAGTPDMSRSHFETQDTIELGQPLGARRDTTSGFMNRLARELAGAQPMAFTDRLPLAFRGPLAVPNVKLKNRAAAIDPRRDAMLAKMYAHDADLSAQVQQGIDAGREVSAALANEMVTSGRGAVSANGFDTSARRIASVMKGRVNLAFADIGGWDTHVAQKGALDFRLGVLGRGLASFAAELGPAEWRNTSVVVISEFGRTLRENGARGTDHGHGTAFWVMGGNVRGGRIVGEQVKVARATLNDDRDFPVLNEVRSVLGGVFQKLYGLGPASLGRIFPGARPVDLGII